MAMTAYLAKRHAFAFSSGNIEARSLYDANGLRIELDARKALT
jgi:hypothetical protein